MTINLNNLNDNAPVLAGSDTAAYSVLEGATAVATVSATDADNDAIRYSIYGGADASAFAINDRSGVLSFVSGPSYSSPTDSGHDNIYNVTVQASDGFLADTQAIAVTVTGQSGQTGSTTTPPPEPTYPTTFSIVGDEKDNVLTGTSGNDSINAKNGDDVLYGLAGNDILEGGPANDTLYGGLGDDVLYGGSGFDKLYGGAGDDSLYGGQGSDTFYYNASLSEGTDYIYGFETGGSNYTDQIAISNTSSSNVYLSQTGTNSVVTMSGTDTTIVVVNATISTSNISII